MNFVQIVEFHLNYETNSTKFEYFKCYDASKCTEHLMYTKNRFKFRAQIEIQTFPSTNFDPKAFRIRLNKLEYIIQLWTLPSDSKSTVITDQSSRNEQKNCGEKKNKKLFSELYSTVSVGGGPTS